MENVRSILQVRYDTFTNWNSAEGRARVLLEGEIGTCTVSANEAAAAGLEVGTYLKVGDGKTTFYNLPWASARTSQTVLNALENVYTKNEIDNYQFITVEEIDAICGTTIANTTKSEVRF